MHKPAITLSRNSPSILQFVNGGGGAPLRLKLSNNRLCSWAVLAWDGVYIKNRSPQLVLYIVPGGRCEVEVLCTQDGRLSFRSLRSLTLINFSTGTYSIYNIGNGVMMQMVVTYGALIKRSVTSEHLAGINRPPYLTDLYDANATVDQWFSVNMNQDNKNLTTCGFWMGSGSDCSNVKPFGNVEPAANLDSCAFRQFVGIRGENPKDYLSVDRLVTFPDSVHEWTLYGPGSAYHALSVHPHVGE